MDVLWKMLLYVTCPMFNRGVRVQRNDLVETSKTAAGLQFAKGPLVSKDMKSNGLNSSKLFIGPFIRIIYCSNVTHLSQLASIYYRSMCSQVWCRPYSLAHSVGLISKVQVVYFTPSHSKYMYMYVPSETPAILVF